MATKKTAAPIQADTEGATDGQIAADQVADDPQDATTPEAETASGDASETEKNALRIASRGDSFRRCGRTWRKSGEDVLKSTLTEEEIDRLKSEPELIVIEVDA